MPPRCPPPIESRGWASADHSLKSPTTETQAACGAQTRKVAPSLIQVRPEDVVKALMAAFAKQPAVVVGDRADHGLTLLDTEVRCQGDGEAGAPDDRRRVYRAPPPKTSAGLTVGSTRIGFRRRQAR